MTIPEKLVHSLIDPGQLEPELLEKIAKLSQQNLTWLSGFCAGLVQNKAISVASITNRPDIKQSPKLSILVLYASQSGNSQAVAGSLAESLSNKGIQYDLKACEDLKTRQITNYSVILMVASTHGEGEAPDNVIDFHEFIRGKKAPKLTDTQHAVLSLGDSSYEFFCQTGKDFDEAFSSLGSKPLLARVDCDLDYEDPSEAWITDVISKIDSLQSLETTSEQQLAEPIPISSAVSLTSISNLSGITSSKQIYNKKHPYIGKVLTLQKLTGRGSVKETFHVEISIEGSGIEYKTGDALGIWALNNSELVDEILNISNLDGSHNITLNNQTYSLREALIEKLEITQISKKLLSSYNALIASEDLTTLLQGNVKEYIENNQLIDVLIDFPVQLTEQQLVELLSAIKPRVYSIASSQQEFEDEIHLTVDVVSSKNKNGARCGLASNYLVHQLEEDAEIAIYLDPNPNFRLPAPDVDIIMIGPGTGVAPFRAFLQEREATDAPGKNWLFFGNPNFNSDFYYQVELQKHLKSGLLTHLDVAFSRDQPHKIYVQHRLLEQAQQIWQWLETGTAQFYVCGDLKHMAKDVEEALLKIISLEGRKSADEALNYLKKLRKDKRYLRDVY